MTSITYTAAREYLLQPHIYLCRTAEGGVVLDSRRGQYFGLTADQMSALSFLVRGYPHTTGAVSAPDSEKLAEALMRQGVLTQDVTWGKQVIPIDVEPADSRFVDMDTEEMPPVHFTEAVYFLWASLFANLQLSCLSLKTTIAHIKRRKARRTLDKTFDEQLARELTKVFHRLRPLYTAKKRCLYDSLVLIEFLALHGVYPQWVIGVKAAGPFLAHSWVQHRHFVLNGEPEFIKDLVPLMLI